MKEKITNHGRKFGIAMLIIAVIVGSIGVVSAATITVDKNATDDIANNSATTVSYAVNNAADGDTIELANDSYTIDSTINVTTNNLTVMSADGTSVTLNATNTSSGKAFNTSNVNSFTLGGNIVVESGSSGGGLFGGSVSDSTDMALMAFLAIMLVGGYMYVKDN